MAEMTIEEMGKLGQEIAAKIIKRSSSMDRYCQIDWLVRRKDGDWWSLEVKYQEPYKAPPFDGHGLPVWQVETRMLLFKENGIRPMLMVFDCEEWKIYWQWIDMLESGDSFDTPRSKRRVYPLTSFEELEVFDDTGKLELLHIDKCRT